MFGASLRPWKDIWRRFLCKIYMVCPYKLVTCKQNASKKVQNLLKTAVSAGRQSHPRNGEQACSKSHMDFSGSDFHISHQQQHNTARTSYSIAIFQTKWKFLVHFLPPPSGGWVRLPPIQLLEYQTDMLRCRFDTLGRWELRTVGRGQFPHRYKPSSLLRLYTADKSALPMLELGLMPVVTTMGEGGVGDGGGGHW